MTTNVEAKEQTYLPGGAESPAGANAPRAAAPAISAASSAQTFSPDQLPPGVRRIVDGLRYLFLARNMEELCTVMPLFTRDVTVDTMPLMVTRKGELRISQYMLKGLGVFDIRPLAVQVRPLHGNRHSLHLQGTLIARPRRSWLVPPTMLLPERIEAPFVAVIGVVGSLEDGQVEYIHWRYRNAYEPPRLVRSAVTFLTATIPHATEPIWGYAAGMLGDPWYKARWANKPTGRYTESQNTEVDEADLGAMAASAKESLAQGASAAQQALVQGTVTAQEGLARGTAVARETVVQNSGPAKERLLQGAAVAQDGILRGTATAQEAVAQNAGPAKERLLQGAEVAKGAAASAMDATVDYGYRFVDYLRSVLTPRDYEHRPTASERGTAATASQRMVTAAQDAYRRTYDRAADNVAGAAAVASDKLSGAAAAVQRGVGAPAGSDEMAAAAKADGGQRTGESLSSAREYAYPTQVHPVS